MAQKVRKVGTGRWARAGRARRGCPHPRPLRSPYPVDQGTAGDRAPGWRQTLQSASVLLLAFVAAGSVLVSIAALLYVDGADQGQLRLLANGQLAERFTTAVGQLGQEGPDKLQVRIGGAYGLERVMESSPDDRRAVVEILSAFVRTHAPAVRDDPALASAAAAGSASGSAAAGSASGGAAPEPSADVQAALTVLGRGPRPESVVISLPELDLAGVELSAADLRRARLAGSDLRRARLAYGNLTNANLTNVDLTQGQLSHAHLTKANLTGTNLGRANLTGASLAGANVSRANLAGANVSKANLAGANLAGADLAGANLAGVDLAGADLAGADLRGAKLAESRGLTSEQLATALTDAGTTLPAGTAARSATARPTGSTSRVRSPSPRGSQRRTP